MFKKRIKLVLNYALSLFLIWSFNFVKAEVELPKIKKWSILPGPSEYTEILEDSWVFTTFLPNFITWLLGFLALAAIVVITIWGYIQLTAFGNDDQTTKGKDTIMYGVIGLLIVILSYAVVSIVQNFTFFI